MSIEEIGFWFSILSSISREHPKVYLLISIPSFIVGEFNVF